MVAQQYISRMGHWIFYAGYGVSVPVLVLLTDPVVPKQNYLLGVATITISTAGFAYFADDFYSACAFRALWGWWMGRNLYAGAESLKRYHRRPGTIPCGLGRSCNNIQTGPPNGGRPQDVFVFASTATCNRYAAAPWTYDLFFLLKYVQ